MQKPWMYQYAILKTDHGFIIRRSDAAGNILYLSRTAAGIAWIPGPDRADNLSEKAAWHHMQAIIEGRI